MINKRLLIKNLLAHNNENSFYDKKRQLNLHSKEGKGKFLKHICALSNSNPFNNSYIVVGVEDDDNEIVGDDFFDDSRIQNLVNAYLENPPKITYDNIPFPNLPKEKVVGLVTIKPKNKVSFFKKNIYTIYTGNTFIRIGSNTSPTEEKISASKSNVETVISIENNSRNSIQHTLDGVLDFITVRHKDLDNQYQVFKENFVVCWAGKKNMVRNETYYSRVDIELVNEQIKLFYSNQDEVIVSFDEDSFTITEYVKLGLNDKTSYYPLEKITFYFYDNGYYKMETQMLFEPPQYNKKLLHHIYNSVLITIQKLHKNKDVSEIEVLRIPHTLMICYLNDFRDAKHRLIEAKSVLKAYKNPLAYIYFKDSLRILRKMKYN
ncbi:ATP-binding protein [Flavobacterium terrigena]|uniref:Putative DNA-binding domain-containing protein n=1 Tax=Flavobacterium terrigena TaxID=402734 RepID=A0A1H6TMF3_9FLAO|nr:ATP-binding protein [Flavobacterium terrigena]SEI77420.1 Putative DNA-binding domain-containing protein [Flavobacterium terrigena]